MNLAGDTPLLLPAIVSIRTATVLKLALVVLSLLGHAIVSPLILKVL